MGSKAKKKRKHLLRNKKIDPTTSRKSWNGVIPVTKKTPSKKSLIEKIDKKYKK